MRWRILAVAGACLAIPGSVQAQAGIETLSKVELLALQQEMRDRGCGNRHAPGVVTAETRRALRNCLRQHNVTTARDLLVAFNIGFGPDEPGGLGVGARATAAPINLVRVDDSPNRPGRPTATEMDPPYPNPTHGARPGKNETDPPYRPTSK